MENNELRAQILATIIRKSSLKQRVFDSTFSAFNLLKDTLLEMASELEDALEGKLDRRVRIEYRDRGKFETQLQVASDMLLFQMQTDVFCFDPTHPVLQTSYLKEEPANGFCGVINIYNFLSDSFKFNRKDDEGYLIGRIFINHTGHYFVEGKGRHAIAASQFGSEEIDREALIRILEEAIDYALDFDPYMPPYSENLRVTVDQFNSKMDNSKFITGKRLGYDFEL
ncbi:MAG: hypothetical protein IJN55_02145 [Alistipes sp.]|nr:hypothetical protein [Alistipes sp.]